jgi:hypothetical protein
MEQRSSRRIRELVTPTVRLRGLSANEIECALISMMARSTSAPPKGRIHWCETEDPAHRFLLQRTAGPYIGVKTYRYGDFERTSDFPPIAAEIEQSRERGMCAKFGPERLQQCRQGNAYWITSFRAGVQGTPSGYLSRRSFAPGALTDITGSRSQSAQALWCGL